MRDPADPRSAQQTWPAVSLETSAPLAPGLAATIPPPVGCRVPEERNPKNRPPEVEVTTIDVHCLHGTLQHPDVWAGLESALSARLADARISVTAEDIAPPGSGGLAAWAEDFCARIAGAGPADLPGAGSGGLRVLMGYSLGGRLALHALLACPGRWSAAVVVAAHPGGASRDELASIRQRDAEWARRCRTSEWIDLLAEWDRLPVFGGRANPAPRGVDALDRERCARVFEAFSRGRQADLRDRLAAAAASGALPPLLYISGAGDARYTALGDELADRVRGLRHLTIAGAGHRVPWEQPEKFADAVSGFLSSVSRS